VDLLLGVMVVGLSNHHFGHFNPTSLSGIGINSLPSLFQQESLVALPLNLIFI